MTPGSLVNGLAPLVVLGFAVVQFVNAGRRRNRTSRTGPSAAARPAPAPVAPPAAAPAAAARTVRVPQPVARAPKRPDPPPPVERPAGPLRAGGPRWAANAVIAAEVFGPPVALRPGGAVGPPSAL